MSNYTNYNTWSGKLPPLRRLMKGSRRTQQRKAPLIFNAAPRGSLASTNTRRARLIGKRGECEVKSRNIENLRTKYLRDVYTTVVELKWHWTLAIFVSTYVCSWTFFTIGYTLSSYQHGDLFNQHGRRGNSTEETQTEPCIANAFTFLALFMFSVETQATIGYGYRYVTDQCPLSLFLMCWQTLSGVIIEACLVAVLIAKVTRPGNRAETIIFSKNAVISMRDGQLCFMFRLGDCRRTHLIDCHVKLMLIRSYETLEREVLPFQNFEMEIDRDSILLAWPTIVCHRIDEHSPLFEYAKSDVATQDFEIVAILEGVIECTGNSTQARTSYRTGEILWGHRFEPLLTFQSGVSGSYHVNYARFQKTYEVETPTCSAKTIHHLGSRRSMDDVLAEMKYQASISMPLIPITDYSSPVFEAASFDSSV